MGRTSAVAASIVLMALASASHAHAQSAPSDRSLMFNPNSLRQTTTPQTAKQQPRRPAATKTTKRPSAPPTSRAATSPRDTLPRLTVKDPPAPVAQPMLGRIPLDTGTFGLSTDKQYRTTIFSDGRVTPGFENVQTKDPSYFGLSLSVPTDKTSIIPLPFLSRPD